MEADWSAEIGANLPVIAVPWTGFVDLVRWPDRMAEIEETRSYLALGEALAALNGEASPVLTSKCDVWLLAADEIDPLEFGAETACGGIACYIDLLPRNPQAFASFAACEAWARHLTRAFRDFDLRQGRIDLVIRGAELEANSGFGMTLYAAGCGANEVEALASWQSVLAAAVAATISYRSAGE